ncbi:MAG: Uma2 family endonuclease [Gemmatimonadaceae bacterium]|nr:Uma2 family endonuclease [Gemmatimonadaceae bacterium]
MPYAAQLMTAEDLLANPVPNMCTELVAGHILVREPPGYQHGDVAARLLVAIGTFAYAHKLGRVLAAESGFTLFRNPDTVRAPDVAFIRADRVPDRDLHTYPEFAPDLAVEVLSPSDRAGKVLSKVGDWIDAGARLVWVVDPVRRLARVYRADGSESLLSADDALDGEDVLPGLVIPIAKMIDHGIAGSESVLSGS